MLANGFGEHNIQGIGDKHIPLIHNVMNTDVVAAVSDRATDSSTLRVRHRRRGASTCGGAGTCRRRRIAALGSFGLSSICNVLAAIKTAKYLGLGPTTSSRPSPPTARRCTRANASHRARDFAGGFDDVEAARRSAGGSRGGAPTTCSRPTLRDRERIFNLGYYTWVEQQGVSVEDFTGRRRPGVLAGPARDSCPCGTR